MYILQICSEDGCCDPCNKCTFSSWVLMPCGWGRCQPWTTQSACCSLCAAVSVHLCCHQRASGCTSLAEGEEGGERERERGGKEGGLREQFYNWLALEVYLSWGEVSKAHQGNAVRGLHLIIVSHIGESQWKHTLLFQVSLWGKTNMTVVSRKPSFIIIKSVPIRIQVCF